MTTKRKTLSLPTTSTERRVSAAERGYGHRWRKARDTFLSHHPLCAKCEAAGRVVSASVVDHIAPHKGDQALFWDTDNWQPLCKPCHDSTKRLEEYGKTVGCDVSGVPVDPAHHWR